MRSIWKSMRGREAHPEIREGSGGPPVGLQGPQGSPAWIKRPSRKAGRVRVVLPQDREGSGGPPGSS